MCIYRILVGLLLVAVFPVAITAGNVSSLFEHLKLQGKVNSDTLIHIQQVGGNKPIVVEWGSHGPVHIGISLFDSTMKEIVNQDACNFVERLFLELLLYPSVKEGVAYLKRKNIELRCNDDVYGSSRFKSIKKLLDDIDGMPSRCNVNQGEGFVTIILEYGLFNHLELKFPSTRELVLGLDKSEADVEINKRLRQGGNTQVKQHKVSASELLEYDDKVMKCPGTIFQINRLRNDSYYYRETLEPVFDVMYLTESINNLMLGLIPTNKKLEITHRKYGDRTPDIVMGFNELFNSFAKDTNVYTGLQTLDDGRIQAITVFYNRKYDYLHMLIVSATRMQYFYDDAILHADFFSNIPQHYIKNLF
jgi:hypothetical protein